MDQKVWPGLQLRLRTQEVDLIQKKTNSVHSALNVTPRRRVLSEKIAASLICNKKIRSRSSKICNSNRKRFRSKKFSRKFSGSLVRGRMYGGRFNDRFCRHYNSKKQTLRRVRPGSARGNGRISLLCIRTTLRPLFTSCCNRDPIIEPRTRFPPARLNFMGIEADQLLAQYFWFKRSC